MRKQGVWPNCKPLAEGQRFSRWTVVSLTTRNPRSYLCRCGCGTQRVVDAARLRAGRSSSCGCITKELNRARSGAKHHAWKGGRCKTDQGYFRIPTGKRNGELEHRIVMSQYLGRPLTSDETVHHINGIRTDNRIKNLELRSKGHGAGQRVSDLIKWATELLTKYKPEALHKQTVLDDWKIMPLREAWAGGN
jgi:hypothetical protein